MLPADAGGILQALNVDEDTINGILQILDEAQDIKGKQPGSLSASVFGKSDAGSTLGFHTDLAHQTVIDAMTDMVKGFDGLATNVQAFKKHAYSVDDGTGQALTTGTAKVTDVGTINAAGNCTSSPTVSTSSCTLPNGG